MNLNPNSIWPAIAMVPTFMNIFLTGIIDSLSLLKCYKIIVGKNDNNILFCIGRIFGANLFLLLGSVLIYSKGIEPVLNLLNSALGTEGATPSSLSLMEALNSTDVGSSLNSEGEGRPIIPVSVSSLTASSHAAYLVYHGIWVGPIFLLCYLLSNIWYQELANLVFKNLRNVSSQNAIVTSFAETIYALVVWFFIFIQIQMLINVLPMMLDMLHMLIVSRGIFILSFTAGNIIYFIRNALYYWGLVDMGLVYAWYCFDNFWISSNVSPDRRFEFIHLHWIYFLGFGFPYVLLMTYIKSYFARYAVFLAIYPFSLLLGSVSDFKKPYDNYMHTPMQLRVFDVPKKLAQHTVDAVVSKIMSKFKRGTGVSDKINQNKKHSP